MGSKQLWIGTSNIVLPGSKLTFPESFRHRSRLHYYSTLFNSVEINSTFYKLQQGKTFARWTTEITPGFVFTIKLSRDITHAPALAYDPAKLDIFLANAGQFGEAKGCLLVQFPGSVTISLVDRVAQLLSDINARNNILPAWRLCVEFRHNSWYSDPQTPSMLDHYGASLVFQDYKAGTTPDDLLSGPTVYLRFHGPAGDYTGSYNDQFLRETADRIITFNANSMAVFAYFNNTLGNAFANARTLAEFTAVAS